MRGDEQLAGAAVYVVEPRKWFLAELSHRAAAQYQAIAEDAAEVFKLHYAGPLAATETPYRDMLAALKRSRDEDKRRLYTTFGPHRDDILPNARGQGFTRIRQPGAGCGRQC